MAHGVPIVEARREVHRVKKLARDMVAEGKRASPPAPTREEVVAWLRGQQKLMTAAQAMVGPSTSGSGDPRKRIDGYIDNIDQRLRYLCDPGSALAQQRPEYAKVPTAIEFESWRHAQDTIAEYAAVNKCGSCGRFASPSGGHQCPPTAPSAPAVVAPLSARFDESQAPAVAAAGPDPAAAGTAAPVAPLRAKFSHPAGPHVHQSATVPVPTEQQQQQQGYGSSPPPEPISARQPQQQSTPPPVQDAWSPPMQDGVPPYIRTPAHSDQPTQPMPVVVDPSPYRPGDSAMPERPDGGVRRAWRVVRGVERCPDCGRFIGDVDAHSGCVQRSELVTVAQAGRVARRSMLSPTGVKLAAPYALRAGMIAAPLILLTGPFAPLGFIVAGIAAMRTRRWWRSEKRQANTAAWSRHMTRQTGRQRKEVTRLWAEHESASPPASAPAAVNAGPGAAAPVGGPPSGDTWQPVVDVPGMWIRSEVAPGGERLFVLALTDGSQYVVRPPAPVTTATPVPVA